MILSNVGIRRAIQRGAFSIEPLPGSNPAEPPFNTTSIDLRLGQTISLPRKAPVAIDLKSGGIARFLSDNCEHRQITHEQPYCLGPNQLVLGLIVEEVKGVPIYAPNQFRGQTTPAGK